MENRLSLFCDRVIEAGWLAAAVTVPLFFNIFSSRVFEPDKLTLLRSIVLIMAAAWLIRYLATTRPAGFSLLRISRTSPLMLPVLLFTAVYILATAVSVVPQTSLWGSYVRLQGLVTNLCYLTLFFLVAHHLRSRDQINRLVAVIIVTSIPISLYGVIQHFKLDPLPWGGDVTFRVTSTMGNAIFLAAYLIMVIPLTLVWLVQTIATLARPLANRGKVKAWLLLAAYGAALGLQLLTVVLTMSRGPWIGLAVGLVLLGLLWLMRRGLKSFAGVLGAATAALLAFSLVINIPGSPLEPIKKASVYLERLGTILDMEAGTNRVRTLIWFGDGLGKGAAGLITETPGRTILGHGPESMYVAYNPYYPPDLAHLEARNATPDRSHNDFLDYLVTMGFLGLFAYLLVMVRAFSLGLQRLWKEADFSQQGLLVGILGALTAHVVESLTGIAIASTLTYTWLLLGCLAAMTMTARDDALPATSPPAQGATAEGQRAKRRRMGRKDAPRGGIPASTGQPWFKRIGFYLLTAYLSLTAIGIFMTLRVVAPRDPDPVPLVVIGYGWLLVGILVAALWVERPAAAPRRVETYAIVLAIVVGLVAIVLPVKLFLGSVIADIYFKKGQTMISAQRFDQAVSPYLEAIQWDPDQDYYFLFLGQAYLELARTSGGEKAPQKLEGINDLLRFRDRSVVAQLGRENLFQAALVTLKRAQKLNSLNTDHSANLGRLYRLWGEVSTD
ncbi:MAG: O-antigen ligase family protein, partial [Dehalococcoidia bacterium]|nr:O-antigen ligase family protein [Dehalococcoidia bacterium]